MIHDKESSHTLPHFLLIYRAMLPSVRLCVHGQLLWLAEQGFLSYRAVQELRVTSGDLKWADTVIQVRSDSRYEAELVKILKDKGRYLVYVLDDDLFHVPIACGELSNFYAQPEVQDRMRYMMEQSDAFFSSSPLILKRYAGKSQLQVLVRGFAEDVSTFEPHDPDGPVRIVFAGSTGRWNDISTCIGDALVRLKKVYKDHIEFIFIGGSPASAKELHPIEIPYTNSYEEYRRCVKNLKIDIGLAPMPDSSFHACKYINKFIEYSSFGIVSVCSNVEHYMSLKRIGAPGIFCDNTPEAWFSAIQTLVENPKYRERLRRAAYSLVKEQYSVSKAAELLLHQIKPILQFRAQPAGFRKDMLFLHKTENICFRFVQAARKYKWRLPVKAAKKLIGK